MSRGRVTPLARVAAGTMACVKHALDAGAQGIIVPMVHGPDEVREARAGRASRPRASVARGPSWRTWAGLARPDYLRRANAEILVGVQIETREAVVRVEEILDVPGVELCFIGPNDLHLALGCAPRFWSEEPAFTRAVARVRAAAAESGASRWAPSAATPLRREPGSTTASRSSASAATPTTCSPTAAWSSAGSAACPNPGPGVIACPSTTSADPGPLAAIPPTLPAPPRPGWAPARAARPPCASAGASTSSASPSGSGRRPRRR